MWFFWVLWHQILLGWLLSVIPGIKLPFNVCFTCWHFKLLYIILKKKLTEEKPFSPRIFLWIFSTWAELRFSPITPDAGVMPIIPQWVNDTNNAVEATRIACVHDCPLLWIKVVICNLLRFLGDSTKKTACCGQHHTTCIFLASVLSLNMTECKCKNPFGQCYTLGFPPLS